MSTIKNWNDVKKELKNKFEKLDAKFFDADQKDTDDVIAELQRCYSIGKHEAQQKYHDFAAEFEKQLPNITDNLRKAGKTIEEYSSSAVDTVSQWVDSCKDVGATAKAEVEDGISCVVDYIKDNPLKSVLMALTAGLLINKFTNK